MTIIHAPQVPDEVAGGTSQAVFEAGFDKAVAVCDDLLQQAHSYVNYCPVDVWSEVRALKLDVEIEDKLIMSSIVMIDDLTPLTKQEAAEITSLSLVEIEYIAIILGYHGMKMKSSPAPERALETALAVARQRR